MYQRPLLEPRDVRRSSRRSAPSPSEAGITLPELSLRWLLSKPVVSAVLLGGSKPDQLEANITAAQAGPLTDDVIAACDEAGLALAGPMPAYNR